MQLSNFHKINDDDDVDDNNNSNNNNSEYSNTQSRK